MLTKSQKRYLFAIYRLGQNGRPVKSTEVASVLGVTKASTVKMTQKLIDEGYIIKEPYREITLTSEGIKAANELYTPSVILQDFLENRVGVERKNAENDSVAIVSQISEDALDKLVSVNWKSLNSYSSLMMWTTTTLTATGLLFCSLQSKVQTSWSRMVFSSLTSAV